MYLKYNIVCNALTPHATGHVITETKVTGMSVSHSAERSHMVNERMACVWGEDSQRRKRLEEDTGEKRRLEGDGKKNSVWREE